MTDLNPDQLPDGIGDDGCPVCDSVLVAVSCSAESNTGIAPSAAGMTVTRTWWAECFRGHRVMLRPLEVWKITMSWKVVAG